MAPSTLSYADRAKKAQKIRSPIENTVHAVSVSMPVSSATTSPFSSNDSSASSSMGSSGTVISSNSTDVDAADTTAPTTSNSSVILESDGEGSGEQKEQAVKEKEEARSVRKPAVVNVWQQRMADANQPGGANKRELTPSKVTLKPEASSSPAAVVEEDDAFIVKVRPAPTSWSSRPPLVSPSWSGGTTKPSAEKPVSLELKDPQSWPEVGLGSPNKAKGKGKSGDDEHQTLKGRAPSFIPQLTSCMLMQLHPCSETESPPRSIKTKSKSKWVAIPAQELQAAADAAGISSRRQQHAKSHSASQSSVHSESQSHSRNQSHSRESSLSRPPVGQTIPKVFRTGSKSVSRAGTASGPHSRMHSRSASTHASPAACREVGLPPQETEEQNLVAPRSSSAATPASSLSTESTLPISTYIIPSPASPLPSVFPVQIQQQQQQFKANTGLPQVQFPSLNRSPIVYQMDTS
ncbi:hypothetical protein D9757_003811 [Collybiopsis confluens]|uniref:Uncharacterized protein n=1 Tax=Collybiopsis confluens TaxID=2823264 RepID=A0A8H5HV64_9AGAR|nr:hypothetical protein D9757_003811 [Collybiopsis confluens]